MKEVNRLWIALWLAGMVALGACRGQTAGESDVAGCTAGGETSEIEETRLYVEYNHTDGDLGVHGLAGGVPWEELCVYAPDGEQILRVAPTGRLGSLGMDTIFFESREPELDAFGFAELEEAFPEGAYAFRALSVDGELLTGTARFTHDIAAAPAITAPALAADEEDAGEATVPLADLVVSWEAVSETHDGRPVTITSYEVIVTKEEHEDPDAFSRPIYDVHLPPEHTSLMVPGSFFEAGTVYELEVLALEESGNQTISVGFFATE